METAKNPSIPKAILYSILLAVNLYVCAIAILSIFAIVILILSYIPIIRNVVALILGLIETAGDGISVVSTYISIVCAYYATTALGSRIIKNSSTLLLAKKLSGIYIIAYSFITMIYSIVNDGYIFPSICFIIAGFVFIFSKAKAPNSKKQ